MARENYQTHLTALYTGAVLLLAPLASFGAATQLRCEYQDRPIAIEAAQPRLSWIIKDDSIGARQTAYRVLVATCSEKLQEGQADLWDSGKVASDQSVNVTYAGKPLTSGQRACWTVRVWDADDKPSEYAPATFWEMGVLKPSDWRAKLIRMKTEPEFTNDAVEHWMRYGIGSRVSPSARAWVEKRMKPAPYLRREFTLDAVPTKAKLLIASLGYYELFINGKRVGDRVLDPAYQEYDRQIYYVAHDVTGYLKQGKNAIGLIAIVILPVTLVYEHPYRIIVNWVILALGMPCASLMFGSMTADICDEDELATGMRREGAYVAAAGRFGKVAGVLTLLLGGWLPRLAGYVHNDAPPSIAQLTTMRTMLIVIQLAAISAAMICVWFYPITRSRSANTRRMLAARKQPLDADEELLSAPHGRDPSPLDRQQ